MSLCRSSGLSIFPLKSNSLETKTIFKVFNILSHQIRRDRDKSFAPKLVIVQVGGRADSNVYVNAKIRAAAEAEVVAEHLRLPR